MAVKDYPIKTSEDEFTRLSMQSDLFRGDAESYWIASALIPGGTASTCAVVSAGLPTC